MAKRGPDDRNKKGSIHTKDSSMFWPVVCFIVVAIFAAKGCDEQRQDQQPDRPVPTQR